MRKFLFLISCSGMMFAKPVQAHAHLGHLGEVAGHSHWIFIGAGIAAVALATALGKKKREEENPQQNEETSTGEDTGIETEGAAA